jgi:hypothetical protein
MVAIASDLSFARSPVAGRSPWALSLPLLIGLVVFVVLANPSGLPLLADPDSHWHIAVGNWILQHRTVPTADAYSYTFTGRPWIAKEWGSQVLMALAYKAAGWSGVVALCAAAFGITSAVLLRLLLQHIRPLPALLFTAAALSMTASHCLARPFALAFPFMLWWVAGLIRAVEERRAPDPVLLMAMLVWANLHAGFTFGLMLTGVFAFEALVGGRDLAERKMIFRGWLKFAGAALLVSCITPYGAGSILVTFRILGMSDALALIAEWKSPDFQAQPLMEAVLLIALYLVLARGVKLPLMRVLIVIGLMHMFLHHVRYAELLATLAPLAIAPVLARDWPAMRRDPAEKGLLDACSGPAGRNMLALSLVLGIVYIGALARFGRIQPPDDTAPTAALAFAREAGLTEGRVLNHYGYGGYLISVGIPTFIDGRGELFGGEFIRKYAEAIHLTGGDPNLLGSMLERWDISWTLLLRNEPANKLLARLPGWQPAYADDKAMIFVRER